jgi:hypothetical protein
VMVSSSIHFPAAVGFESLSLTMVRTFLSMPSVQQILQLKMMLNWDKGLFCIPCKDHVAFDLPLVNWEFCFTDGKPNLISHNAIQSVWLSVCLFFSVPWTQGFTLAGQVLYHFSYALSPSILHFTYFCNWFHNILCKFFFNLFFLILEIEAGVSGMVGECSTILNYTLIPFLVLVLEQSPYLFLGWLHASTSRVAESGGISSMLLV